MSMNETGSSKGTRSMKRILFGSGPLMALFTVLVAFQNCSPVAFDTMNGASTALGTPDASVPSTVGDSGPDGVNDDTPVVPIAPPVAPEVPLVSKFKTIEDVKLAERVESWFKVKGSASKFVQLSQTVNGQIISFDAQTGSFEYQPGRDFIGEDKFQYSELDEKTQKLEVREVLIEVLPDNDLPWIVTDRVSFEVNVVKAPFNVEAKDVEDGQAEVVLALNPLTKEKRGKHGVVAVTEAGLVYTPDTNFRGTDEIELFAKDREGGIKARVVRLVVGNPFHVAQPAVAVRGSACISCHAQLRSDFMTDFGFGDNVFFGGTNRSQLNEQVWTHRFSASQSSNRLTTSWESMVFKNGAGVIVPKADFPSFVKPWVDTNYSWYTGRNNPEWTARTVAEHVSALENRKPLTARAATVREVDSLYIGAPSVGAIRAAGKISATAKLSYWKNSDASMELSGFAASGTQFTNEREMVCDGDVFVEGTVFLKDLKLKTIEGCRIHATGPIFTQGSIEYVNAGAEGQPNHTNLQLVSARLVSMGVGTTHCESSSNPGWYKDRPSYNPLSKRLKRAILTRNVNPASSFEKTASSHTVEQNELLAIAATIPGLADASCHGREKHFERLMVVGPLVHSRYVGNFKGVIISEFALFALGKFSFEFDPVFKQVPVFPLLRSDSYLKVD